ncbi:hypothetical protein HHL22_20345 [Hymenobacter sp. RP-2-7]|uniref:IPT/TIG domain-containing protein n=1 Tax=Hymenobacter polaris TaxID=2682546 RepID=A0A7Y0FP24_9BACT|nr:IPT/TIG domain-containing protein [Hymenobacter polaris]NML67558.1 hypothetical protein [Hymenobacter polaris]
MRKYLLVLVLGVMALTSWGQVPDFKLTKTIGTPVFDPMDVTVDKAGNIYLLDGPGITKLAPSGELLQSIVLSRTSFNGAALDVDDAGNLYVGIWNFVRKYSPAGQLLLEFGTLGSGPGQLRDVGGLAVDGAGNIYVADTGNNRLQKFDTNGKFLFDYQGAGPNQLDNPKGVTLAPNGDIYLFDRNLLVTQLSAAGALRRTIALGPVSTDEGTSIAVDAAGSIYLSTFRGGGVTKYDASGKNLKALESGYDWSESTHTAIALDAAGNVYATTFGHHGDSRLLKFDASGKRVERWGNLTSFVPAAMDAAGNYYYVDQRDWMVSKFSPTYQLLAKFAGVFDATAMAIDVAGNIYLASWGSPFSVTKLGPDGRVLATYTKWGTNLGYNSSGIGLAVDAQGTMYVPDFYGSTVLRMNAQGTLLPSLGSRGTGAGQLLNPVNVAVDAHGFVYVADNVGQRVQRFAPGGQFLRAFGPGDNGRLTWVGGASLAVDGSGTVYLNCSLEPGIQIFNGITGDRTALPNFPKGALAVDRQATRLLSVTGDVLHFYSGNTARPHNLITGNVYEERDGNCRRDATDPAMPGMVVAAQPGDYYGLTDASGNYAIEVDTGAYQVGQLLPSHEPGRAISEQCATSPILTFHTYGNTALGPDFGNQVSRAPYLTVSVAVGRRRRCARSTTSVAYANKGFATAPQAQAVVALPPYVVLVKASAPYTRDAHGNYVFALGDLAAGQYGSIVLQDSVVCGDTSIRGLTLCTKAWLTPPNTYPEPAAWNKASMAISSTVEPGNQVRFVVRNQGRGATTDSLGLRLYQDAQLALTHRYALGAGDSLVLRVPATRAAVRLEADQPAGHPLQAQTSATVEVAALRTSSAPTAALAAMPPPTGDPEVAQDCQPVVDSFDPNDKQVLPAGVTAQHYTPTQAPLSYQLRFQNTGTAPAYYVSLVDTLSADLDLRTLRLGASSHPYQLTVTGQHRPVLTFTFSNLELPARAADEAGSQGFVQFTIQPKAGLAPKTLVANYADIFFDYNPPVRTNTTLNRLYDLPAQVVEAVRLPYAAVVASPALRGFAPAQGRAGTRVVLSGERFAPDPASNRVYFNSVAAPVLAATATTLTVRVPAGATPGQVQVVTPNGSVRSAADFLAFVPPTLAALTPAEGVPGAVVTLAGTGFSAVAAQDSVAFGGVAAVVRQATPTALTVEVPATASTGLVTLRTLGGQATSGQVFRVWYPPTVSALLPAKARAGKVLTLSGTNFAEVAARNEVSLGGAAAPVLAATSTQLQLQVPASAASGALVLRTPGGTATVPGFVFVPAPVITDFAPRTGSIGTQVTVTGQHFGADAQADTIYVGGVAARVLRSTATEALVVVPKGARTGPLAVAGAGGRGQSSQEFALLALPPAEAVAVYPNPTHGPLLLDWQRAGFAVQEVCVYNTLGALLLRQDLRSLAADTLALPTLLPGLYLVVVQTALGPVTKHVSVY